MLLPKKFRNDLLKAVYSKDGTSACKVQPAEEVGLAAFYLSYIQIPENLL